MIGPPSGPSQPASRSPVAARYLPSTWLPMAYRNVPSVATPCRASGATSRRISVKDQPGVAAGGGLSAAAARSGERARTRNGMSFMEAEKKSRVRGGRGHHAGENISLQQHQQTHERDQREAVPEDGAQDPPL